MAMRSTSNLQPSPAQWNAINDALAELGVTADINQDAHILRERRNHFVCSLKLDGRSLVLKSYAGTSAAGLVELQSYALLGRYQVPTVPVVATGRHSLLLQDVSHHDNWRLASTVDVHAADVGSALARWYAQLHAVGAMAMRRGEIDRSLFRPWTHIVRPEALRRAASRLDLEEEPGIQLALNELPVLLAAFATLPWTLNYSDFCYGNMALTRGANGSLQAIVFDYDQMALGPAYSDWRNVMLGLRGLARPAFKASLGTVDPLARRLDAPLSNLHALVVASSRSRLPGWAEPVLQTVRGGGLERQIRGALQGLDEAT